MVVEIVCVLKCGKFANTPTKIVEYKPEHVVRLYEHVARNLKSGFKFYCITDTPINHPYIVELPLINNWQGWWSKMELFRYFDRAFYLDLDTSIVGELDAMVQHPHEFTMLRNLSGHNGAVGSGVMAWDGDYTYLYEAFKANPDKFIAEYKQPKRWGDQAFIQEHVKTPIALFQDLWPKCVQSFKYDLNYSEANAHPDCAIVAYHGKPKPWEV